MNQNVKKLIDYKMKEQGKLISNKFKFQMHHDAESENIKPRRWIQIERYDVVHARIQKEIKELHDAVSHPYANMTFDEFEDLTHNPDE